MVKMIQRRSGVTFPTYRVERIRRDPSDMCEDELPRGGQKTARRKKVPKTTNKEGIGSGKEKRKKGSGKYLFSVVVKRLEETLCLLHFERTNTLRK